MDIFLNFLQTAKSSLTKLETFKEIHIILGNESCDLDSTVSTLSLAFLIYHEAKNDKSIAVIPVLNIAARYMPLRTEICYLLDQSKIPINMLIFKDEIDFKAIINLKSLQIKTSIVDHHVLAHNDKILEETVVEIFDHRPINTEEICKGNIKKNIHLVGSCTTLISKEILKVTPTILFKELGFLLYATIVYDTIGLKESAGKTTEEDKLVIDQLVKKLELTVNHELLFDTLWKVHNDTSTLKTKDLLFRDLKIVQNIPIPGLPQLVQDYVKRSDSKEALESFLEEMKCSIIVLIGIDASGDVKRDIGVYYKNNNATNLLEVLRNNHDLNLHETPTNLTNFVCFQQNNIKLTRKYILPLVNSVPKNIHSN